ncbi:MAG TPA: hypothetical protein VNU95_15305 [Candidatus Acidoferrales bacterium]|nr:hypothetical protein [Candidatus Acidoferrales bacterium]
MSRTFSPVFVSSILMPIEYARLLAASPPAGFEELAGRQVTGFLFDGEQREIVFWKGRLPVPKGQTVELDIPAKNPAAVSGSLHFSFEYRGVAGVGLITVPSHAPIEVIKPGYGL